ncbi:MAG: hypothetical protein QOE50_507 [Sphingomonadales bacterium]|nr:hypothetical protein [Sphingomonadales bacterium]
MRSQSVCLPRATFAGEALITVDKHPVYEQPSDVEAVNGAVQVDGPDSVDVALTPEAAEETSERLSDQAVKARGQRRLKNNPHRGRD